MSNEVYLLPLKDDGSPDVPGGYIYLVRRFVMPKEFEAGSKQTECFGIFLLKTAPSSVSLCSDNANESDRPPKARIQLRCDLQLRELLQFVVMEAFG